MSAPWSGKIAKGLSHFGRLKKSVGEASSLLAGDIQLFLRVMKTDASNWYRYVNSFDLLQPAVVDGGIDVFVELAHGVRCVKRITPTPTGSRKSLNLDQLLGLKVMEIDSDPISLKAVLNTVAYSGDVHPEPDFNNHLYRLISERVLSVAPEFVSTLIQQLGEVLVESFEGVFDSWSDVGSLRSIEHHRQPKIVLSRNVAACEFANSYMQAPLKAMPGHGVRLIIDYLALAGSANGHILAIGHRSQNALSVQVTRQGDRFAFWFGNTNRPKECALHGGGVFSHTFRWLEVCTYPDGTTVAAMDGFLCGIGVTTIPDLRVNAKLIIGSDLDGENSNAFQSREVLIDYVAADGRLVVGHRYGFARRMDYDIPYVVGSPNLMRRWVPPAFISG